MSQQNHESHGVAADDEIFKAIEDNDINEVAKIMNNLSTNEMAVNNQGDTAIQCAIRGGYEVIVRCLLKCSAVKTQINRKNNDGETALHVAVRVNRREFINTLLQNGANLLEADAEGNTPLHLAI